MNKNDLIDSSEILRAVSSLILPPLPYAENALEPVITTKTMSFSLRETPQRLCGQPEQTYFRNRLF